VRLADAGFDVTREANDGPSATPRQPATALVIRF
jgi:hypothetical protein